MPWQGDHRTSAILGLCCLLIYNANGRLVASDDNDGSGSLSQLKPSSADARR